MIIEERDPVSGAIRFKEDEDTRSLKALRATVKELTDKVKKLEERVKKLEDKSEKDS